MNKPPGSGSSFERKMIIVFCFIVLAVSMVGVVAYRNNSTFRDTSYWVERTHHIISLTDEALSLINALESADHAYMITGDPDYVTYFANARKKIRANITDLKASEDQEPDQQRRVDSLLYFAERRCDLAIQGVENPATSARDKTLYTRLGGMYMEKMRNIIAAIRAEETGALNSLQLAKFNSINKFNRIFFLLLLVIVLLFGSSIVIIRQNVLRNKKAEALKQSHKELEEKVKGVLEEEAIRRRILFEQAKDGIMVLNEDRMVVEANKAFAMMLGYAEPESVLGLHVYDWDPVYNTPEKLKAAFPTLPLAGEVFETTFVRKDGSHLSAHISLNVIDIDGTKLLFNVCRDITERLKYINAIEQQNKRLKEIAWFQSHVVRAPLARIMGLVHILENEPIEQESTTEVLSYILVSAKELDAVIKSIVDNAADVEGDIPRREEPL